MNLITAIISPFYYSTNYYGTNLHYKDTQIKIEFKIGGQIHGTTSPSDLVRQQQYHSTLLFHNMIQNHSAL